ncbi:hypothetical protein WJX81_006933 [Elliptochloris bilobata]|uniref:Uncharacterized protein n=1 Tax=Elliptochloris bilobata TaxID=381761 RepID=A0AAW1RNQ0_9CHLO
MRDQGIEVDNWQPGDPPVLMLCTDPRLRYTDAPTLPGRGDASLIFMLTLGHLLLLGLVKGFWEKELLAPGGLTAAQRRQLHERGTQLRMLKEFGRSYRCVTKSAGTWTMEDWMMFCTCHECFLLRDNLMGDQFTEAWRSLCDASCFALRAVHPDDPHLSLIPFTPDGIHICVARLQRYSQRVEQHWPRLLTPNLHLATAHLERQLLHCGPSAVTLEFWVERQMHAVKARYDHQGDSLSGTRFLRKGQRIPVDEVDMVFQRVEKDVLRSMRYEGKSEDISRFVSLVYVAALGRPAPVRRLVEVVSFVLISLSDDLFGPCMFAGPARGGHPTLADTWEVNLGHSGNKLPSAAVIVGGGRGGMPEGSAQRRFRQRQKEKMEELQARVTAEQGEKAELTNRSKILVQTLKLRKEELRQLRARQAAPADAEEDALSREFAGSVTLTFREDRTVTLTPAQIKGMTEKDLARTWSQYVKELAVLLVAVEGRDPPAEVLERIQALVQRELLFLYIRAALTNMSNVMKFVAAAVVENVRVALGSEGPAMWRGVAAALQLTEAQRADIVTLWRAFREKLAGLVAARAEIHTAIAATMPMGTMARDFAIQFLAAQDCMDALKRNLRSEHVLIHEFLSTFYTQKLTVLQMARCVVRSFPYYPDIPAIVLWVAATEKDSCAISVLQQVSTEFDAAGS